MRTERGPVGTCGVHGVAVGLDTEHGVKVHVEAPPIDRLLGGRGGGEPWRGGRGRSQIQTQESPAARRGPEEVNVQRFIKMKGNPNRKSSVMKSEGRRLAYNEM